MARTLLITTYILLNLFKISSQFNLNCNYQFTHGYAVIGRVYVCVSSNVNIPTQESSEITDLTGTHENLMSNRLVDGFHANRQVINYFPQGLNNYFPNLQSMAVWRCGMREIHQTDLKPFTQLRSLSMSNNRLQVLEEGLFNYNPNLEVVGFHGNRLVHIHPNIFDNLIKMTDLYMGEVPCINKYAETREQTLQCINTMKMTCVDAEFLDMDKQVKNLINESETLRPDEFNNKLDMMEKIVDDYEFSKFKPLCDSVKNLKDLRMSIPGDYPPTEPFENVPEYEMPLKYSELMDEPSDEPGYDPRETPEVDYPRMTQETDDLKMIPDYNDPQTADNPNITPSTADPSMESTTNNLKSTTAADDTQSTPKAKDADTTTAVNDSMSTTTTANSETTSSTADTPKMTTTTDDLKVTSTTNDLKTTSTPKTDDPKVIQAVNDPKMTPATEEDKTSPSPNDPTNTPSTESPSTTATSNYQKTSTVTDDTTLKSATDNPRTSPESNDPNLTSSAVDSKTTSAADDSSITPTTENPRMTSTTVDSTMTSTTADSKTTQDPLLDMKFENLTQEIGELVNDTLASVSSLKMIQDATDESIKELKTAQDDTKSQIKSIEERVKAIEEQVEEKFSALDKKLDSILRALRIGDKK